MQRVSLGSQGLTVSRQGLGCMGMSEFYGTIDEPEAVATIHRALDLPRVGPRVISAATDIATALS